MQNEKEKRPLHTTLDAYQAGYLSLRGHMPRLEQQGPKVVFIFQVSVQMKSDLDSYYAGASVPAHQFAVSIKNLKSQIFALKSVPLKNRGI